MNKIEITQSVDCGPVEQTPANRPARSVPANIATPAPVHTTTSNAAAPKAQPPKHFWRKLGLSLAVFASFVAILFILRTPILRGMATAWIINTPIHKSDAIVVLGGGTDNRPFAAAELYRTGMAPRVLYMDVKETPVEDLHIALSERELTHQILLRKGVPEEALITVGKGVASTYDESKAVAFWVKQTGAKSIIIATDKFHTRRARWIFQKELRQDNVEIQMFGVEQVGYKARDWWHNEQGLITFENEVLKFLYYHWKY